jgi:peroxiredoxin
VLETMAGATAQLAAMGITDRSLRTGDQVPDFELPNHNGESRRLSRMLDDGVVVLNFYRGGWCPYCNLEFKALTDWLPEITARGATLVGISPELPDATLSTRERAELPFEVLSDIGNRTAEDYGLVMEVPDIIRPLYEAWGVDLLERNGDASWRLPLPATYVIDDRGVIAAGYVNKDHTLRMEPADIVAELDKLSAARGTEAAA